MKKWKVFACTGCVVFVTVAFCGCSSAEVKTKAKDAFDVAVEKITDFVLDAMEDL